MAHDFGPIGTGSVLVTRVFWNWAFLAGKSAVRILDLGTRKFARELPLVTNVRHIYDLELCGVDPRNIVLAVVGSGVDYSGGKTDVVNLTNLFYQPKVLKPVEDESHPGESPGDGGVGSSQAVHEPDPKLYEELFDDLTKSYQKHKFDEREIKRLKQVVESWMIYLICQAGIFGAWHEWVLKEHFVLKELVGFYCCQSRGPRPVKQLAEYTCK